MTTAAFVGHGRGDAPSHLLVQALAHVIISACSSSICRNCSVSEAPVVLHAEVEERAAACDE